MRALAVALAVAPLVACGPVSLQQAERICFERARDASGPHGEVKLGATSYGVPYVSAEVNVSSDTLQGRDPSQVYESCVFQKSGKPPSRPLYDRPDWKG
jgi:hypothetical protein